MSISPQFADGIGNITMIDGIVRLDLVELRAGPDNKPQPSNCASLAMPLPGFLRAVDQMNQVVNRLVEQGILTRNSTAKPQVIPASTGSGG